MKWYTYDFAPIPHKKIAIILLMITILFILYIMKEYSTPEIRIYEYPKEDIIETSDGY